MLSIRTTKDAMDSVLKEGIKFNLVYFLIVKKNILIFLTVIPISIKII